MDLTCLDVEERAALFAVPLKNPTSFSSFFFSFITSVVIYLGTIADIWNFLHFSSPHHFLSVSHKMLKEFRQSIGLVADSSNLLYFLKGHDCCNPYAPKVGLHPSSFLLTPQPKVRLRRAPTTHTLRILFPGNETSTVMYYGAETVGDAISRAMRSRTVTKCFFFHPFVVAHPQAMLTSSRMIWKEIYWQGLLC